MHSSSFLSIALGSRALNLYWHAHLSLLCVSTSNFAITHPPLSQDVFWPTHRGLKQQHTGNLMLKLWLLSVRFARRNLQTTVRPRSGGYWWIPVFFLLTQFWNHGLDQHKQKEQLKQTQRFSNLLLFGLLFVLL